jgi:hypothetical protein
MHRIGSEARKYSGYRELNYAICCLVVFGILYKNRPNEKKKFGEVVWCIF